MRGDSGSWFAIHVRSNAETTVSVALRNKGYDSFLPMRRREHLRRKTIAHREEPLFPGYVFCRLDDVRKPRVVTTPGVIRIVGYGKVPAAIDVDEIFSLRKIAESNIPTQPMPGLRRGDRIVIQEGPLAGVAGCLQTFNRRHQLIVSITLLSRSVLVELEPEWVGTHS